MSAKVLIADSAPPVQAAVRKFLESAGFKVRGVHTFSEAVTELEESEPELLFTSYAPGGFDGETLCRKVKEMGKKFPVVIIYPPEVDDPDTQATAAGANACLVGPLKRGNVVSCARMLIKMRGLEDQVEKLESDLKRRAADGGIEGMGNSPDFEFFKKFLLMEVKRSRRHRYPVSFLLVGLDHLAEKARDMDATQRTELLAQALKLLSRGVRDIDLALPFAEGRYLVFLPHTTRDGAVLVALRARERLAKLEQEHQITNSVGIASFEPGPTSPPMSFASLMKDATEALQRAQQSGGNRVESGGKIGKRERISLA